MSECSCYHCGLPVPAEVVISVPILGEERRMCCAGCEAVARSIVDGGLVEYYRHRDAMPESRREALPEELVDLGLFDSPDFQASFVTEPAAHEREATLLLEGITCAACVWLNEQHVARQPGVLGVHINYATRRAKVRWDARETRLSVILAAIQAIGYRAYPYDPRREEQLAGKERRAALWRLFVAGFGTMQVMMYALPEYVAGEGELGLDMAALLRWASLVLTLPVIFYSSAPFFRQALLDLRARRLGMDVPVALGVGGAFVASVWATLVGHAVVYFDSVSMFVFFLLCGRYLEMLARHKAARGAEELGKILPATAERLPAWPDPAGERVDVAKLVRGDVLRVKAGAVVPVDGELIHGEGTVDESLLTGESAGVPKRVGSALIGGSVNGASPLVMRVTGVGDSTRLAGIRRLIERGEAERPRLTILADRVAGWFVAFVMLAAAATGLVWLRIDASQALWVTVSVLVVSCPCALSLATPVALTVATSTLARNGVLVTRGNAIESLARADHVVFDKTGTLTTGRLAVERLVPLASVSDGELQAIVLGLEVDSEHRIAEAIRQAGWPVAARLADERRVHVGEGVSGRIEGQEYRLGRAAFVAELSGDREGIDDQLARHAPNSVLFLGSSGELLASLVLGDSLREGAAGLVGALRERGVGLSILSGDALAAVHEVGRRLGIEDARGELLPEQKLARVEELQRGGAVVAMVGDGVNDGPVLAKAHVSVAMGEGTELARNQADIVLLGARFAPLGEAYRLVRRCRAVVRQNLGWALAYNLMALPAAMAGWVTPWMAGLGMSLSSLIVILNALRLQRGF